MKSIFKGRFIIILSIILGAFNITNCKTEKPNNENKPESSIVIGHFDSLYSEILGESRKLMVHIPRSAMDNPTVKTKYPVLFLLDGQSHFKSVTGMIEQLSTSNGNMVVPEMIVVGIINTNRTLDLTPNKVDIDFISGDTIPYPSGGGNKFLDFVEKELVPHIEESYPASPYRTFVGHSFGGLSVINALVTKPDLFSNYIAVDPSLWWDNRGFLNMSDSMITKTTFENKALYIGVANTIESGLNLENVQNDSIPDTYSTVQIKSIMQFVKSMDKKRNNGLSFKWKYYPEDDHGSVPLITEYDALRFFFSWYKLEGVNDFFMEKSALNAENIVGKINYHYDTISDKFGYRVIPPEDFVNSLGYGFMNNEMLIKASALFEMNIKNYPESSNVYDSMGDCLLAQKDSINALNYFKKALAVGKNDFSQDKIDMLQEKLE